MMISVLLGRTKLRNRRNYWLPAFFSFSHNVCKLLKSCVKPSNGVYSKLDYGFPRSLTLSHTNPGFYRSASTLLKTLLEKEKLLVTSNFSFSHIVFYPFGELSTIFTKIETVVCKLFQTGSI